jgi:hypothetical protein
MSARMETPIRSRKLIGIAADHGGYELKEHLLTKLHAMVLSSD